MNNIHPTILQALQPFLENNKPKNKNYMNRPELYQKTVDILVHAYFEGTLEHGECRACAVGNIVAANLGIKLVKTSEGIKNTDYEMDNPLKDSSLWYDAVFAGQLYEPGLSKSGAIFQMNATGYTPQEIATIEGSFEGVDYDTDEETHNFNGLMAVVDALDQIHENTDEEITTTNKDKFKTRTPMLKNWNPQEEETEVMESERDIDVG